MGQTFDCPVDEDFVLPIGRAKIERAGAHVTIVAYSIMVGVALKAAQVLAEQGVEAEVINLRSLRPLDIGTVVGEREKNQPPGDRGGRLALCRHRRGNFHAGDRARVRLAGCAAGACGRTGCAAAICRQSGKNWRCRSPTGLSMPCAQNRLTGKQGWPPIF